MQESGIGVPGPGSYSHKQLLGKEGKSYSLYSKTNISIDNIKNSSPGPGWYDLHIKNLKKEPAYALGSEKRPFLGNKESLSTPSLNAYNPNHNVI